MRECPHKGRHPVGESDADENRQIFIVVDIEPEFPGGEVALHKFLEDNIRYPRDARASEISGKVYLTFVVEEDGSISNPRLLRDIGCGCGEEALRVVKLMPKWKPGRKNGQCVHTQFNLPIDCSLLRGFGLHFDLNGRTVASLPMPERDSIQQGKLVVKIWVDRKGNVTRVEAPYQGSTITTGSLIEQAKDTALKARFSPSSDAPEEQVGTITYVFSLVSTKNLTF